MSISTLSNGIHHDPERRLWALTTAHSTYALGVTREGYIVHLYWGPRLVSLDDLPDPRIPQDRDSQEPGLSLATEEYPPYGGMRYGELAAQVEFTDGTRDLDLRFTSAEIDTQQTLPHLTINLHDPVYPLTVSLHYRLDPDNDLLRRSATFHNHGSDTIILERSFSAVWHLPRQFAERTLTTLAGQWISEMHMQQRPLVAGTTLLESRKGITGATANPWFALQSRDQDHQGEVYFGALAWSGNWVIRITSDNTGATAIAGGIHDHDFRWSLQPGSEFATPDFVAGFADDGLNGMRHRLHQHTRQHVLPRSHSTQPRPILYNSWEATIFDVHEPGQLALAEKAARLGVELFVVDDGWFKGRNHDRAGLGDWFADPHKFPQGLSPLIAQVHALGMQFGIWVEPEMVNPDSDLYRAHPDWVYHFPQRQRSESRNQLVLNLGREDVQHYLFTVLNQLVSDYPISYIKWDMNRPISEPGWPDYRKEGGDAREIWVRHTRGVYTIMDRLRAAHPQLSIEACASGGSRADLGILERTDIIWTSDNTNPEARLFIQEGFSLIFPARVMSAWVTDNRDRNTIPFSYSCHVAMLGALGIGGNLLHWSDADMDEVAKWIAVYKQIRPLVQDGEQTWLLSPHDHHGNLAAVQYTSPDAHEAVVFAFRRPNVFGDILPPLRLQHLLPTERYTVSFAGLPSEPVYQHSGAALMHAGINVSLWNTPFDSCVIHIRALD